MKAESAQGVVDGLSGKLKLSPTQRVLAEKYCALSFIGEGFCADPELGLNEEQLSGCQTFIAAFMPPALQTVFGFLDENAALACNTVYHQC